MHSAFFIQLETCKLRHSSGLDMFCCAATSSPAEVVERGKSRDQSSVAGKLVGKMEWDSPQMYRRARIPRPVGYLGERQYQRQVKEALDRLYAEVEIQWQPFRGEGPRIYAPVVDVAVGPFAIERRYIDEYGQLLDETRAFIDGLIARHNANLEGQEEPARFEGIRNFNENARCLLCIEIEESGSRKHCLGNLVNASALGRIGVLIARQASVMRVFVRQRAYLHFLAEVQKNTFRTENALILTAEQFTECLAAIPPRA